MFFPLMSRIWFLLLLGGLLPGVQQVSGIDVYTSGNVDAVNGTNVRLKCTFKSSHPVSPKSVSVSWNFRPLNSGTDESVFYYQEEAYPPTQGRFKGHAVWSGDIMAKDASITLHEVPPTFNGTFTCQVRNLPDVHGSSGEINLRVVDKVPFSEITILAIAIGVTCVFMLIVLAIFVAVRVSKRKGMQDELEMYPQEPKEWKDPTVCSPEEAIHLTVVKKEKEAESSDDEESEPSSGDDEEEDGLEEDDDDDDDDDEDDDDDDDDGGDEGGGILD